MRIICLKLTKSKIPIKVQVCLEENRKLIMYEFSFPGGACWNAQWSSNCNCASWDWSVPVHRLFHVTADQAATNVLGAGRALAHHSALETKQASKEGIGAPAHLVLLLNCACGHLMVTMLLTT